MPSRTAARARRERGQHADKTRPLRRYALSEQALERRLIAEKLPILRGRACAHHCTLCVQQRMGSPRASPPSPAPPSGQWHTARGTCSVQPSTTGWATASGRAAGVPPRSCARPGRGKSGAVASLQAPLTRPPLGLDSAGKGDPELRAVARSHTSSRPRLYRVSRHHIGRDWRRRTRAFLCQGGQPEARSAAALLRNAPAQLFAHGRCEAVHPLPLKRGGGGML